jgi:hypothetical protein
MRCLYNTHQPDLDKATHIKKGGVSIHEYTCINCGSNVKIKRWPGSEKDIFKIEDIPRELFRKSFNNIYSDNKIEIYYRDEVNNTSALETIISKHFKED